MTRFFLMLFTIIFVAVTVLMLTAPDQIGGLLVFVFSLLIGAGVLKLILDFLLHQTKSKEEKELAKILGKPKVKTFFSIEEYSKALKKLSDNKRKRSTSK